MTSFIIFNLTFYQGINRNSKNNNIIYQDEHELLIQEGEEFIVKADTIQAKQELRNYLNSIKIDIGLYNNVWLFNPSIKFKDIQNSLCIAHYVSPTPSQSFTPTISFTSTNTPTISGTPTNTPTTKTGNVSVSTKE